jgi:carboxyl-terminal processing protease
LRKSFLLATLLFVGVTFWTAAQSRSGLHRIVLGQICELVAEKFFRNDTRLQEWLVSCRERGRIISLSDRSEFLRQVQFMLNELEVSHLSIFDPIEDRRLWRGEARDTGIRTIRFGDRFVVNRVLPGSAAERMGVLPGDEVLRISGAPPRSDWSLQTGEGEFVFKRGEREIAAQIEPTTLTIDERPQLNPLTDGGARLSITSFRAEYFSGESWAAISNALLRHRYLIVDLRGNAGGNVVAMLRGLSTFFCQPTPVGKLAQPRSGDMSGPDIPDDIDDRAQLTMLEKYHEIKLNTFSSYGCYTKPVTVLVDEFTASVAEIFAAAMRARPQTRVWGRATSGDVLIATWYALPLLGAGYSVSIPEALYLMESGEGLEAHGVWPDRELDYELSEVLSGQDSWILRATGAKGAGLHN